MVRRGRPQMEELIDGATGRSLGRVALFPCFYQILRHFVADKLTARARGPTDPIRRQPREGRSNNGGQRLGEMETGILMQHGASITLAERCAASDSTVVPICTRCGLLAEKHDPALAALEGLQSEGYCRACNSSEHILMTPVSFGYSGLLANELAMLGIRVKHVFAQA